MRSELAKLHLSMNLDKTEKCCWYQILRLITEMFDFSACQFITVYLVIFNTFSCFQCVCWDRQSLSHDIYFTRRSIEHCEGPGSLLPSWLWFFPCYCWQQMESLCLIACKILIRLVFLSFYHSVVLALPFWCTGNIQTINVKTIPKWSAECISIYFLFDG